MSQFLDFRALGWTQITKEEASALIAESKAVSEKWPNGKRWTRGQTLSQKLGGKTVRIDVCFAAGDGTWWKAPKP